MLVMWPPYQPVSLGGDALDDQQTGVAASRARLIDVISSEGVIMFADVQVDVLLALRSAAG